jgi:hypothetical protein
MLSIQISSSDAFGERLYGLSDRVRTRWNEKLEFTAKLLYEKVIENLSGRILQVQSGQLRDSVELEVFTSGYDFIAFVGPVPVTPKAVALEFGGAGDYLIPLGRGGVLANRETGFFSKSTVVHPPSKEYAYLRTAMEEIEALIPTEFDALLREEF